MLDLGDRMLLPNGKSIISEERAAKFLFEDGKLPDGFLVLGNVQDLYNYTIMFQEPIAAMDSDFEQIPPPVNVHSDEDLDFVFDRLSKSKRLDVSSQEQQDRIEKEMSFFVRSYNVLTLKRLIELIDRFDRDRVVWGVGRGSACASFVMFLLRVHDIDPIRFNIPFEEFSKETDDEYE